jgi:hypothetical protein
VISGASQRRRSRIVKAGGRNTLLASDIVHGDGRVLSEASLNVMSVRDDS